MLRNISAWHVIIVVLVVVLLFGAKRLPDLAKSVGQSMKIFKHEVKDLRDDDAPTATTTTTYPPVVAPSDVTPVSAPPAVPPVVEPQYVTPVRPVTEPSEGNAPPKA
ncbi:Sec-independent protein translocase subunit TatA [Cellulomonas humilata]|uniref:Sec-independent protein translocase protein TatA n=1 Tax=Cellulomonas humilata TaxID=144055 RepID=A0ABU0EGW4_9CELL|nr:Sec-independent protein translocase subunit TatA [Cellulomonas humilata]MDQ0374519.1 sec-independent protein translocase protein TatA [Cellulomonas humilata]